MLAGGQEVGRRWADASRTESRVCEGREVGVVAAELGVDGLRRARMQRALQRASWILHLEPRTRVCVHVPPRGRAVCHLA